MLILAAILIALIVPLAVVTLRATRLRMGLLWLGVVISAFVAWILVLYSGSRLPLEISLLNWQTGDLLQASPGILVDEISWPFAVAVMTLTLAVLLTDIVHFRELDQQVWASALAMGGTGLIAVVAGNALTLLLALAVIDISESAVLLRRVRSSYERERVVISFAVRAGGLFLLMVAMLQVQASGMALTFSAIPPQVTGLLLLAAGLRSGVIPPHQPYLQEPNQQRGLGTLTRLVPVAASLSLAVRVAVVGTDGVWLLILMSLIALALLYGSVGWLRSGEVMHGQPYWILSFSALVLAAAANGLVFTSAAWGLALLFSGATLFFFEARKRPLWVFPILGAIGFSALPFTPAWDGVLLFSADSIFWGYRIIFGAVLALFLIGYFWHARRAEIDEKEGGFERWMWLIYPLGLFLLVFTHFGIVYYQWSQGLRQTSLQTQGWWYGLIPLGLAAIFLVLTQRNTRLVPLDFSKRVEIINFNGFYRLFWRLYRLCGQFITLFSRLLEGEGGILWALLILILLVVSVSLLETGVGFEL